MIWACDTRRVAAGVTPRRQSGRDGGLRTVVASLAIRGHDSPERKRVFTPRAGDGGRAHGTGPADELERASRRTGGGPAPVVLSRANCPLLPVTPLSGEAIPSAATPVSAGEPAPPGRLRRRRARQMRAKAAGTRPDARRRLLHQPDGYRRANCARVSHRVATDLGRRGGTARNWHGHTVVELCRCERVSVAASSRCTTRSIASQPPPPDGRLSPIPQRSGDPVQTCIAAVRDRRLPPTPGMLPGC